MVEKQLQIEASAAANGHAASQPPVSVGEVQLFLHDYKSFNMLTCLNSLTQLVRKNVFYCTNLRVCAGQWQRGGNNQN